MAIVFLMNEEIARGMVCFFNQKKHSYLIFLALKVNSGSSIIRIPVVECEACFTFLIHSRT
jgi:hypothetical protein